ncbi:MAG TPA: DUF6766 family protein [Polyangiaceae bacterium]
MAPEVQRGDVEVASARTRPRNGLANHSLSIAASFLFLLFILGQALAGFSVYNDDLRQHGQLPIAFLAYLQCSHFLEATFENWESEFLQMGMYVLLTVKLYQKGSSESKTRGEPHSSDEDPRLHRAEPGAPWPVRKGGLFLRLYEHSLSIALLGLFLATFAGHALSGVGRLNEERLEHGESPMSVQEYLTSANFWFESLQNWQSEFLAVLAIVSFTIFLRQRGSPQSKPVAAPHWETDG